MLVLLTNMIGRDPAVWNRKKFHALFKQVIADLVAALENDQTEVKSLATGKDLLGTFRRGEDEQAKDDIITWLQQFRGFSADKLLTELSSLKEGRKADLYGKKDVGRLASSSGRSLALC